jgi:hypothetical protein
MKLLLSGATSTGVSLPYHHLVKLNGSHAYLDAAADLGLSAGQARRVTIVIHLSNLVGSIYPFIIQPCLSSAPGYGEFNNYFPFIAQAFDVSLNYTALVISFDMFVHHIGVLNSLIIDLYQSSESPEESVTVSAFVFSDGFDKDSRVDVGNIEGADATDTLQAAVAAAIADDSTLQKAIKMLINKAVQNKLTSAIQYMDDDGVTPILTHTPTESTSQIIRTPS